MIRVNYGTSLDRQDTLVHPDTTIRDFLEEKEIDYSLSAPYLDGNKVTNLDKTFGEYVASDHCRLSVVVKAVNA